MNDRQLRYAHLVWHERSFSRAAAKLGVSQPTLSGQIKLLEDELGFSLFYRHSRGVQASASGQAFLETAEGVVNGLAALKDFARELRGKPGATIRIGLHSGLAQAMVPRITRVLARGNAKIRPELVTATTRRIQRLVHQERLDFGLVLEGEIKSAADRLTLDQIAATEIVLIVPPDHALSRRNGPLDLAAVARQPLIANEPRMGFGRAMRAVLADQGFTPDYVADCDDLESLKYLVQAGGGVALLPRIAAEREIASGALRGLAIEPRQPVPIQLVRRSEALAPRIERFRGQLVKELANGAY